MTLNQDKLIVRYYFWMLKIFRSEYHVEEVARTGTNLCSFVRFIVLRTLFLALVITVLAGGFSAILIMAFMDPVNFFTAIGIILGLALAAALIILTCKGIGKASRAIGKSESVTVAYIKAVKQKVCPLVQFTEPVRDGDTLSN